MAKDKKLTKHLGDEVERKFPTGARGGPYDYTGTEDEIPPPNFDHVVTSFGKSSRKSRLNPDNVQQMQLLVAGGTPIPTACTAIGAGRSWHKWGQRARADEKQGIEPGWDEGQSPELEWLYAMERAKAAFEASMVARVGAAAATDWRAAAWLLERRAPARWFPKHQLNLVANGQKVGDIQVMSTDKLIQIAQGVMPSGAEMKLLETPKPDTDYSAREVVDAELEPED